jgi:predicted dehydrogenase
VRAAVVGVGAFGRHHARKYAELDGAELAVVVDLDEAAAKAVAEPFGAPVATDLESVLADIDAVSVSAPAAVHGRLAEMCLRAGKHVLVEKPIALDLDVADRLLQLAEARGLIVQVGHQERYVLGDFGLLGLSQKPISIEARRFGPFTGRGMDVSVVLDLMIHDIDMAHVISGSPVVDVTAEGRREHGPFQDHVEAHLRTAGGTRIALAASRIAEARDRVMRIVYPDGEIEIDFIKRTLRNTTGADLKPAFGGDEHGAPAIADDPLGHSIAQFVQSVRTGRRPLVAGEDGRHALETALKIMTAAGDVPAGTELR